MSYIDFPYLAISIDVITIYNHNLILLIFFHCLYFKYLDVNCHFISQRYIFRPAILCNYISLKVNHASIKDEKYIQVKNKP